MKGDTGGAEEIADAALKSNPNDPQANYLAGRIELIQGDPDGALSHLTKTLTLAKDPRTLAWTHIYLGRLFSISAIPTAPKPSPSTKPPSPSATPSPTPRPPLKRHQGALRPAKTPAGRGRNPHRPQRQGRKGRLPPPPPDTNLPGRITTPPSPPQ